MGRFLKNEMKDIVFTKQLPYVGLFVTGCLYESQLELSCEILDMLLSLAFGFDTLFLFFTAQSSVFLQDVQPSFPGGEPHT